MPALPLEEELHRLLDRFESQPEGRLFAPLADCYRRMGRLDEAYRLCVDGLARHPRYSTGFVILGKIHLDREEGIEARTAFETVLSIDPENLVALRQLASDAESRGDRDAATARWEQVLALDPNSGDAKRALGDTPKDDGFSQDEPTLSAGAAPESDSGEDIVLEKKTEAEPAPPEVLTAMSREDSLFSESASQRTDVGDEAETIITVTLADIYYEQGFKAKALEMYRTVLERHPEAARVAGLGEKVDQIEEEMDSLAKRFQGTTSGEPETELDRLEAAPPEGAETATESKGPERDDPPRSDGVQNFRSWVEKHRRPGS